jgi:GntR family transcriptional regulator/MocR family aminotransferase
MNRSTLLKIDRTTFDLPLRIPAHGAGQRLRSLHQQLRQAILEGRLKPGVRLPSTRALAVAHQLARNTVVAAYEMLLSEGYLESRRGSGTVVAQLAARPLTARATASPSRQRRRLERHWRRATVLPPPWPAPEPPYAFRLGVPDLTAFPYATWRRLRARAERQLRSGAFAADDPQGLHALREGIARHVSFTRAVACTAKEVIVAAGAQQAFDLLARVLTTARGETVACEDPGYPSFRAAFRGAGARLAPVPVDQDGIQVEHVPHRARIIYVTPSHQYPLGGVLTAARRAALLGFAERHGAVIIEDDYDSEFRYTHRPLDALQTLDRAGCVFYVGTFSKSLLPDLRIGYIVAPEWAVSALTAAKQAVDGGSSTLTQATLADLIFGGHLARYVRRMRRIYEGRRAAVLAALTGDLAHWLTPLPSAAGLHIAALLRPGLPEATIVARARELEVSVHSLGPYFASRPSASALLFGYGNLEEPGIREGLRRLVKVMARLRGA